MIRFASPDDLPSIRRLWEICFPDISGFNDYFFEHFFSVSNTLLSIEKESLYAMVQMLPYRLRIPNDEVNVTYIYGACTDPNCRRQGHMANLLAHSFLLDQQAGRAASMLIPAEEWLFDFYHSFGYQPFFYVEQRKITHTQAGILPRRLTSKDISFLSSCYNAQNVPCQICRTEADWAAQLEMFDKLGKGAYGWFEDSRLIAYAFCWDNTVQEAIGMNALYEQGLLQVLLLDTLTYTTCGTQKALGCIKWYNEPKIPLGYMNLMLN